VKTIAITVFIVLLTQKYTFMEPLNKHTMLCLGDSYTIGEAVAENERFPMQAVELLAKQNIHFEKPEIVAKTGWTTDELATAIGERHLAERYDIVTLLIGVNNEYRGRDIDNYRIEFKNLLKTAIEFAGGETKHVYVISIPDWGVTPFGANDKRGEEKIGEEIDLFNAVNKEVSLKSKVNYINITPGSRLAKSDPSLIATDGLHPSGKMYAEWAKKLAEAIKL
jgi:lysophospholipase L1-like esterase